MSVDSGLTKIEDLCRLCASDDVFRLDIFGEKGKEKNLSNKIVSCLPFEVAEDDHLPKSLCYKCIYHLETFFDFRKGCIKAIARLEQCVRQSGKKVSSCARLINPDANFELKSHQEGSSLPDGEFLKKPGLSDADLAELENDSTPNPADFLEACLGEAPDFRGSGECFRCETCGRIFSSLTALSIHSKSHRENGGSRESYPCYVCDKVFSSKGHLALHSRVHIGGTGGSALPPSLASVTKLHYCDLCNKSYSMAKHLWGHVSTTHRGHPSVTCNLCLRTFSSKANLEDHRRLKHGDENGEAEEQKDSGSRRKNANPRKIERSEGEGQDGEGESVSATENSVKMEPDTLASCPLCGEHLDDPSALDEHMAVAHAGDGDDPMQYDYLEAEFAENMVESETVFCCEICIREFNDRASLWLHMLYSHREEASKACGLCLKIFPNNDTLITHVETCNPRGAERRRYSCTVCARQHDSRKKLVAHARIHRLLDAAGNEIDPESVVILNSAGAVGLASADSDAQYPCDVCYKPFDSEARVVKHKASAHRETAGMKASNATAYYFVCDLCGLAHTSRTERWRHIATEHAGDETVTCPAPQCGKVFASRLLKQEHCDTHHDVQGVYPSTCEVCGKLWNTRVEYWKHMMGVHPDCLPYVCGVCLKVFCHLTDLVTHVRANHWPLSGGEFCCDICGRPYSKLSKMSRHRKLHATVEVPEELRSLIENPKARTNDVNETHFLDPIGPPFRCELCESPTMEFESLDSLSEHRREVHKVVPCDLCTKYYGRTSHLWKHVNKIHKGHKDVTCPLCERTSASRAHLKAHIGKHNRDNPEAAMDMDGCISADGVLTCVKCSKVFRKTSLMRKHLKHCKGPRPPPMVLPAPINGIYTCEKCPKTFKIQSTLYKHMRTVHVMHGCELCESKLESKTLLYQHVAEKHADDPSLKCDVEGCGLLFRCNTDLLRHKKNHNQTSVMYTCNFCAELITSKMKLRKHLKQFHTSDVKFLCFVCMTAVANYDELKAHSEEVHAALLKRPNVCPVCSKPCTSRAKLMEHIRTHGPNFHPCKMCRKIFPTPAELQEHIANHPGESEDEVEEEEADEEEDENDNEIEEVELDESSIMDIIGAGGGSGGGSAVGSVPDDTTVDSPDGTQSKAASSDSEDTSKRKSPDTETENSNKKIKLELSCLACDDKFDCRTALAKHVEEDHSDVTCQACGTVSCDIDEHEAHLKSCAAAAPDEDGLTDESDEAMIGERPSRTPVPKNNRKVYVDDYTPSACQLCGKVWPAKRHLWQHLIRFHKAEAATTCGVCLCVLTDYIALHVHLLAQHPDNYDGDGTNLTCRVCGKYHNARSKLHSHVAIHVGWEERALAPSHQCNFCDRSFPLFPKLVEHFFNIHKTQASQYSADLSRQTPKPLPPSNKKGTPKPKLPFYTCEVCSLVFASEAGLTNHRWVHKNSDKFKCGQCGEVCDTAAKLAEHKSSKHGAGTDFVCAMCKTSFKSYQMLTAHNKVCRTKGRAEMKQELSHTLEEECLEEVISIKSEVVSVKSGSDSSSDDSSSDSEDSSSSDSDDSSSSDSSSQNNVYKKSALSESSTDEDTVKEVICPGDVEIVEVDANATTSE